MGGLNTGMLGKISAVKPVKKAPAPAKKLPIQGLSAVPKGIGSFGSMAKMAKLASDNQKKYGVMDNPGLAFGTFGPEMAKMRDITNKDGSLASTYKLDPSKVESAQAQVRGLALQAPGRKNFLDSAKSAQQSQKAFANREAAAAGSGPLMDPRAQGAGGGSAELSLRAGMGKKAGDVYGAMADNSQAALQGNLGSMQDRNAMMRQLPGQEFAAGAGQRFNIGEQFKEGGLERSGLLDRYNEQMKAYGASKTAKATMKAGEGKGALGLGFLGL